MNQQEKLEAQFRSEAGAVDAPQKDPFPRMIIVCIVISLTLLFVIMGFLFYDFLIIRPGQNVRPRPNIPPAAIAAPAIAPSATESAPDTSEK